MQKSPHTQLLKLCQKYNKQTVSIRRHLHQYPELSFQEYQTTAYIRQQCKKLGLHLLPLNMETGVLAELHGAKPGPTIAVRTDIDALPIIEQTGLPFKSRNHGCMHACGHDMHMAVVLGAAKVLSTLREQISGSVRFIFQPGEESPPGGARPMIANGAIENVSMIIGLHVDPHLAVGKISLRDGVTMASVMDFDLIIHGQGGHAARPHTAVDAIATAAEVIDSIQKVVSREIDPITPAAITFGKIAGGVARNVIADNVILTGTARALSKQATRKLPVLIKRTAAGICKARGARLTMNRIADYPVLSNTPRVNRLLARTFTSLFGKRNIPQTEQVLGGEDFSCYLENIPGAMFRLGVMNKKIKADKPWHSPYFIADEKALLVGVSLVAATVIDFFEFSST